jgi:hypothetical protein
MIIMLQYSRCQRYALIVKFPLLSDRKSIKYIILHIIIIY